MKYLQSNRRDALVVTAAATATMVTPAVHAASGSGTLRMALIGCGGRGTGAANDAIAASPVPTQLFAVADVFEANVKRSIDALTNENRDDRRAISVPPERRFVGFDGYKKAMDTLRPGDIVILATPLAFRWVHFEYAIEKGLHIFMEKPVVADGPSARRMLQLSKAADDKNLKCAVGLMVRHCRARQALKNKIDDGAIGDIIAMRAYRMHGPVASAFTKRKPEGVSEVLYQIQNFHSFLWASGGLFSDFYIHQIDETSWMKGSWPIKAHAVGGRHYRDEFVDQNFDAYSVEYTYEDGSKLFFDGRTMAGCRNDMSSTVHGSKGSATVSAAGHTPGRVKIFEGQNQDRRKSVWQYGYKEDSPYRLEWSDFIEAIIRDDDYNEVPRGVMASMVTSMGRMAAHTGQQITYEQMIGCDHEFAPTVADLTVDGPAPLPPAADGTYPVPQPGILKDREYEIPKVELQPEHAETSEPTPSPEPTKPPEDTASPEDTAPPESTTPPASEKMTEATAILQTQAE